MQENSSQTDLKTEETIEIELAIGYDQCSLKGLKNICAAFHEFVESGWDPEPPEELDIAHTLKDLKTTCQNFGPYLRTFISKASGIIPKMIT